MGINALNNLNVSKDSSGKGELGEMLSQIAKEVMGKHGISLEQANPAAQSNPAQDIGQLAHQQLGLLGMTVNTLT